MKKQLVFAVVGTVAAAVLCIGGTALAWHPVGQITKSVQDVTTQSAVSTADSASNALTVAPGDTLQYSVVVSNVGEPADNGYDDMANTVMTDELPAGVELISNSSTRKVTENIGTLKPGKSWTKDYQVKVTSETDGAIVTNIACYTGDSLNHDKPQQGCAQVVVKVHVPAVPVYSCNLLSVSQGDNHTVTISKFERAAENGAQFTNVAINWGDNTAALVAAAPEGQTHQYAAAGDYTITATAHFSVNGKDVTATGAGCTAYASFATPTVLPNTGAGNIIIPAALSGFAGYGLYLASLKRHATKRQ